MKTKKQDKFIKIANEQAIESHASARVAGGKAYGLLRMAAADIKVPPGFVLGTASSRAYFANDNKLTETMMNEMHQHVRWLEKTSGKSFGSKRNPLLVSVRSGAPVSMPGMMETLLNIGLNDETVNGLIRTTGNPRLAWDSYRRLIQSYAEVVHGADSEEFDAIIKTYLQHDGLRSINELHSVGLRSLCGDFKYAFRNATGKDFCQDPWKQLHKATAAVFNSWHSERAQKYRAINKINAKTGTACLIQTMVFGNAGGTSGTGVGFTRNPATGENEMYIDYLGKAQGEDVVSGRFNVGDAKALQQRYPRVFEQLQQIRTKLESEFADMQDFEFTVQEGELYLLQTRNGKRTDLAALKIAIDLVNENVIDTKQALKQIKDLDLDDIYQYKFKQAPTEAPIARGTTASTGVACGMIAMDEATAKRYADDGKPVVLVREQTSTDDIGAMNLADAVVTVTGGRTSHAAVVARQLGTACVVGCHSIKVDMEKRCLQINEQNYAEGEYISVDADKGYIYQGKLKIEKQKPEQLLSLIKEWDEDNRDTDMQSLEKIEA